MGAMTTLELFAEANDLEYTFLIPTTADKIIEMLNGFCSRNKLEWGLEQGYDIDYCVFIMSPNWMVEIESNTVMDAIIAAVAQAWQKLTKPDNVIYLEDWRNRG